MDSGIIPMRYAKALLRYATDNGEEERVYAETSAIAQAFLRLPALQQAMLNPVLADESKLRLLLAAATDGAKPTQSLERFLQLVIRQQRAAEAMWIAQSYGTLYRKARQIISGKLVVPVAVSDKLVAKLQQVIEAKSNCKVDFQVEVDPAIQGGFVLSYDTYRLDASVRTELARVKRELSL